MAIKVERVAGVGECLGGQIIGDLAHECTWPAPVIAVTVDGAGLWMDRDTAIVTAMAILECVWDG